MSLPCAHLIVSAVLTALVGAVLAAEPDSVLLPDDNPAKKVGMTQQNAYSDDQASAAPDVAGQRAWSATAGADNSGTGPGGRGRAGVALQNTHLFGLDQVAGVQAIASTEHPNAARLYGAGYHIALAAPGDALDFYASYASADAGSVTAGAFEQAISGKGAVYGARYTQGLAGRGQSDSSLAYGFDYKAYKNTVLLFGQPQANDVTVHPVSITYLGSWSRPGIDASAALTGVRNIAGGDNGGQADFSRVRSGAT